MLCEGERAWRLRTPRLERHFNGAGDMLAGLFLFHCLAGGDSVLALEQTVAAVHAVLTHSMTADGSTEMSLVAARRAMISPPTIFRAEPIS
jgi:pyridoxine kinase